MSRNLCWGLLSALLVGAACHAAGPAAIVSVRDAPASDAWWLRATLNPRSVVVRGLPVKRIAPPWCAADELSRETLGEGLLGMAGGTPLADGQVFALSAALDGSGRMQTALVGAYRRCDGERGLFVMIVEPVRERPRMRFLVELPEPGTALAALSLAADGTLVAWWCNTACDQGSRILYNRETREFYVGGPAVR